MLTGQLVFKYTCIRNCALDILSSFISLSGLALGTGIRICISGVNLVVKGGRREGCSSSMYKFSQGKVFRVSQVQVKTSYHADAKG